ncbi:hypothetical protein ECP030529314_4753 [Escherichia coli p0305293.14]|nr:hypothetical protein ECP03052931_5356 [Escherichia coli p0305293.1]ENE05381.1 hypothetical protein ECP030529314_4753 [Escherichia coli p0305293.14]ENH48546.1 hypothetical protein ECP03052937_4832 [Escherichia coli p0305293.7]
MSQISDKILTEPVNDFFIKIAIRQIINRSGFEDLAKKILA